MDVTLDRIARYPEIGTAIPGVAADLLVRRAPVERFPYHVVYLRAPSALRVLAVAHDRRKPGYWEDRARPKT